jgi:hypothetical protein
LRDLRVKDYIKKFKLSSPFLKISFLQCFIHKKIESTQNKNF